MMTKTVKHQIGNYFYQKVRVPMRDKSGACIRYKNGHIRMRHVKNFQEFLMVMKPSLRRN